MKIRHSTEQDVKRIMEIYSFARRYMAAHGNPNQWGPTNWPPEDLIYSLVKIVEVAKVAETIRHRNDRPFPSKE